MKKLFIFCLTMLMLSGTALASEPITLKQVTSGEFAAERVSGINPLKGTDQYARISADGKRIEEYSFKTGKRTAVLFDVDNTQGEKITSFDGYIMSPDGTRMLIATNKQPIYRRSYKADFYIYTIRNRKLAKLSDGGPQQCPIWSPDGLQVAFVRDNNIFLVKLLYDNAENQVTKDGKFNEVINGIPDWVNEEEFEFNTAMTFNADGTMLCWLRYDEKDVKQYSLQLFKGSNPERKEYAEYPGLYSYKYPKAGTDNSKVSAWSYDIKSHRIRSFRCPSMPTDTCRASCRRPMPTRCSSTPCRAIRTCSTSTASTPQHGGSPLVEGEREEICRGRGCGKHQDRQQHDPRALRPRRIHAPLCL